MRTAHDQPRGRPIAAHEQPYLDALGRRLRELRRAAGLTQAALGLAAGLHPVSVRRIELGLRRTRRGTLRQLVLALGTDPAGVDRLLDELVDLAGPALAKESPW